MLADKVRCFIAIDIKEASILDKIMRFQQDISDTGVKMKLVERENIHLTLKFLGELPLSIVNEVSKRLSDISFNQFEMEVVGVGVFPRLSRPRVIWVGVGKGSNEVIQLYRAIESSLRKIGFRPEREEFIPHITIARVKYGSSEKLVQIIRKYENYVFGSIRVKEFKLKRSTLTPTGPIYSDIEVYKASESYGSR